MWSVLHQKAIGVGGGGMRATLAKTTARSLTSLPCIKTIYIPLLSTTYSSSMVRRTYSSSTTPLLNPYNRAGGPRTSRSSRGDRAYPSDGQNPHGRTPEYDAPPYSQAQHGGYGGGGFSPLGGAPFQAGSAFGGSGVFGDAGGYDPNPSQVPVHIPSDPHGVLRDTDGAVRLLGNSALVIVRQLEMLNVFMGFEQANKYAILSPEGEHVGYMAEEDHGILSTIQRQFLRTHRPFRSVVMDKQGVPVLYIRRPFAFINSRIFVNAENGGGGGGADDRLIGEAQQEWHPWRRRYNLFKHREGNFQQFARIDSGLWAWDFWLTDRDQRVMASINRNFTGFGRELFTDTGQYVVRFDAVEQELELQATASQDPNNPSQSVIIPPSSTALTLDERAMTLATAVSIDFDYFSRHSGSGGMGFPFLFWGGGGGSELGRGGETGPGPGDTSGGIGPGVGAGAGAVMGQDMGRRSDGEVGGYDDDPYGEDVPQEEVWGEESGFDDWGDFGSE